MMDPGRADIEIALRNPYQEKPRTFPALRSKSQMPWNSVFMIFGSLQSSFRELSKDHLDVKFRGRYKKLQGKLSSSQVSSLNLY